MGANQLSSKTRQSNIELLRIISMFLVLVVHANFWALGRPTSLDMQMSPLASYTRFFIESLAIVCVNVFVLISGWFGIKPSVNGFSRFAFQCLFFLIGHYVVGLAIGASRLDIKGIAGCFCLLSNHWFIKSYIGLYILAPVLNAFVKVADKKQLKLLLIVFFLYQTIYGWSGAAAFFVNGYSTMSFIGLYLLGRYLNLYGNTQSTPPLCLDLRLFDVRDCEYHLGPGCSFCEFICILLSYGNHSIRQSVFGLCEFENKVQQNYQLDCSFQLRHLFVS